MCVIGDACRRREGERNECRRVIVFREKTSQVSCHALNPRSVGDSESLHSGTGREKERGRSEKREEKQQQTDSEGKR